MAPRFWCHWKLNWCFPSGFARWVDTREDGHRLTLSEGGGDPHHVQWYEPCQDSIMHSSTAIALDANAQCRQVHITRSQHCEIVIFRGSLSQIRTNQMKVPIIILGSAFIVRHSSGEFMFWYWSPLFIPKERRSENTLSTVSDSFNNFCIFSLFIVFPERLSSCLGMNGYKTHTAPWTLATAHRGSCSSAGAKSALP